MAYLYIQTLWGVHAHWKPLQRAVEVSREHAPLVGTLETSHAHCRSSCWNFQAKVSRELFSRPGINAAKLCQMERLLSTGEIESTNGVIELSLGEHN